MTWFLLTQQSCYFVSRILEPLLVDDIGADERQAAYTQGATVLYRLWVVEDESAH